MATSSSYQQKFYTAEMALPLVFEDTDNDKLIYALIISRSALNQCSFIIQLKCGVDTANQMLEGYSTRAATGRWSVAVFWNLLDTMNLCAPVYNYNIIFITFLY